MTSNLPIRRIIFSIVIYGALMALGQVTLVRRALALTGGDEVVFALTLSIWLVSVAAGSTLGSLVLKRIVRLPVYLTTGLLLLSISVLSSSFILTFAAKAFSWLPGTVPGGGGIIIPLFLAILPIGIFGGVLFPIYCRLIPAESVDGARLVYLFEALGFFAAGLASALIFAPLLNSVTLALFCATLGISAALLLVKSRMPAWIIPGMALLLTISTASTIQSLDQKLIASLRPGIDLLELLETPYGLIEVTTREGQTAVYENGLLMAVTDNPAITEEQAHITLAQHPSLHRVLWIGGFLGDGVEEALRNASIEQLDIVELNPILYDLQKPYFHNGDADLNHDGRLSLHQGDGRRFIGSSDPSKYDLIALNLPGPRSARLAKFYTLEAFELIEETLKPGGILVFTIQASEDYIGEDLAELLGSLYLTCQAVFDSVVVLPGENALFVAGDSSIEPALSGEQIMARLAARGIEPQYWDEYRLQDRFSRERLESLQLTLAKQQEVSLNTDMAPICFYMQQIFWSRQTVGGWAEALKFLKRNLNPLLTVLVLMAVISALALRFISVSKRKVSGAGWVLFTVGLSGLSLEVLTLTAYQVHFGSGYREVGLLIGFYMAGLALGAAFSKRIRVNRIIAFRLVQVLWIIMPVGLLILSYTGSALPPASASAAFFVYLMLTGILGGVQYPLALTYSGKENAESAGLFYSLDLAGAALGAATVGLLALPLIGIQWTCTGLILLNIVPLILIGERKGIKVVFRIRA